MSDMERELVSLPSSGAGLYAIFLASAWFLFQKSAVSCGACMLRHYRVVWLTRVWRRLCDPRDDTKSYGLSVWSFIFVRGVRQRKVTPRLLSCRLKGLILRREVEDREERGMRIGLQYYEQRTL